MMTMIPQIRTLRWSCLPGLVAFLLTAMPFTYGMTRFFFEGYRSHPLGANYFYHLAFDSTAFTLEALSFVVMARSLSIGRCYAFAGAALAVYLVDCGWAVKCAYLGPRVGSPTRNVLGDPGSYCRCSAFVKRLSAVSSGAGVAISACTRSSVPF